MEMVRPVMEVPVMRAMPVMGNAVLPNIGAKNDMDF